MKKRAAAHLHFFGKLPVISLFTRIVLETWGNLSGLSVVVRFLSAYFEGKYCDVIDFGWGDFFVACNIVKCIDQFNNWQLYDF